MASPPPPNTPGFARRAPPPRAGAPPRRSSSSRWISANDFCAAGAAPPPPHAGCARGRRGLHRRRRGGLLRAGSRRGDPARPGVAARRAAPRRRGVEGPRTRRRRRSVAGGHRPLEVGEGHAPARGGRGRRAACLTPSAREEVREQIRVPSRPRGGGDAPVRGPLEVGERPRRPAADPPRAPVVRRDGGLIRGAQIRGLLPHLVRVLLLARVPVLLGALLLGAPTPRLLVPRLLGARLLGARRLLALGARVLGARPGVAPPARQHLGEGRERRVWRRLRRPQGQVGGEVPQPFQHFRARKRTLVRPARVLVDPQGPVSRLVTRDETVARRGSRRARLRARRRVSVGVIHVRVARQPAPAVGVFRLSLERAARVRPLREPRGLRGVGARRGRGGERGRVCRAAAETAARAVTRGVARHRELGRGDRRDPAAGDVAHRRRRPLAPRPAEPSRGTTARTLHGELPHRVAGLDRGQRHRVGVHRRRERGAGAERGAEGP